MLTPLASGSTHTYSMHEHAELRESQQNALTLLDAPATYEELADVLNITQSTARDHIRGIRAAGIPLGEGVRNGKKTFYRSEETRRALERERPAPASSKAAHTKAKKNILCDLKEWLADDLTGRAVVPDGPAPCRPSNEDMVVHRSDEHLGAYYEDETGEVIYDDEIAAKRVRTVSDRVFNLKERHEAAGVEFDCVHVLLGGDGIHGEGIHDDQPWESCLTLIEQIALYVDLYSEFIDRAAKEFPFVQVVGQNGNHGELRGDGMSPDANADDIAFMMLEDRIAQRDYDNVSFISSAAGYYTNFRMRVDHEEDEWKADALDIDVSELSPTNQSGHRGHLRHGQNSLFHIGTSSGQNRWRGWHDRHQFDLAYRGHFHEWRVENIDNRPVVMSGAICPPADYEESFAAYAEPAATVHGVSDERPITFFYPVDFKPPKN